VFVSIGVLGLSNVWRAWAFFKASWLWPGSVQDDHWALPADDRLAPPDGSATLQARSRDVSGYVGTRRHKQRAPPRAAIRRVNRRFQAKGCYRASTMRATSDNVARPGRPCYCRDPRPMGDSLAVKLPALTRASLVRIQVPQPRNSAILINLPRAYARVGLEPGPWRSHRARGYLISHPQPDTPAVPRDRQACFETPCPHWSDG
jgi:hypothetical protein